MDDYFSTDQFFNHVDILRKFTKLMGELSQIMTTPSNSGPVKWTLKGNVIADIHLANSFTFSSINLLLEKGQYSDAYTLLRVLFEGHLHMWNIINSDEIVAKRYYNLQFIDDYRTTLEALEINPNLPNNKYSEESLRLKRKKYEKAIKFFRTKPGKFPRSYTQKSIRTIANELDERDNLMFWRLMYVDLYSTGSGAVHRASSGIREGYAVVEFNQKNILGPNPRRAIISANWSMHIMGFGYSWFNEYFGYKNQKRFEIFQENFDMLHDEVFSK